MASNTAYCTTVHTRDKTLKTYFSIHAFDFLNRNPGDICVLTAAHRMFPPERTTPALHNHNVGLQCIKAILILDARRFF